MSKRTTKLTQAQKYSRDLDAIASGSPQRVARRIKNRLVGRVLAKGFFRWLWK